PGSGSRGAAGASSSFEPGLCGESPTRSVLSGTVSSDSTCSSSDRAGSSEECARPTDLGLARICTACAEGDRTRRPPLTQNRGSAVLPRSPEGISDVPRRRRRKHSKFGPSTSAIKLALPPSDNYQGAAALAMCILSSMRQEGLSARKMLNYVCCCTQLRRISLQTSEAQGASAFKCEPPHIEIPLSLQVQLMDSPKEHA
ncbi:unnamed protein product, partial [Prorocentrum cordatum]